MDKYKEITKDRNYEPNFTLPRLPVSVLRNFKISIFFAQNERKILGYIHLNRPLKTVSYKKTYGWSEAEPHLTICSVRRNVSFY